MADTTIPSALTPEQLTGTGAARYFAMLAHDMRTAIGGITGSLALIDSRNLDPDTRARIDRATESADLLVRLLEGALDVAEMDAPPVIAPIDLAHILRSQSRMWMAEAERKGLRLDVTFDMSAPDMLMVDATRLGRVLSNLVGNAVKFTDEGFVSLRASADASGAPIFEITDAGPGLPEEIGTRLFQAYGRPEGATKPGTGLGLHIASSLVVQMGGTISLENRPDARGCVARVVLPREAADVPQDLPEEPAPRAERGAAALRSVSSVTRLPGEGEERLSGPKLPDLGGLRILMAEDNLTNQLVAGQMLQSMNAQVTVASDGAEALELLDVQSFDLLLIDIEMPRVSGLDVIRRVRAFEDSRARLPLIALTAYAMREHREKIAAAGADGLIAKPIMGIREFGLEILRLLGRPVPAEPRPRRQERAGPAPVVEESVVDRAVFDALAETIGLEGMHELLTKVQEDLERVSAGITDGIARRDSGTVRARTHILISVAGAVGASGVQSLAEELNAAAHRDDWDTISDLGTRAVGGISDLIGFVAGQRAPG
ncbi:response regulator (plasmid) [Paroceanicella profunda]|uniref:histidine kinase n=1 Tax=Paroceanicella profunda TaxID=2579971 RepID=A0A5B8FJC9_9RHOB|nr:response regulator [Paroceanicella profunda]QDL94158.1 response regulator [Paroceanicella profunda]